MHSPISPAELSTLIDEADAAARRLHRKLALPAADLEDLRQDLLVDLIRRLPSYDSSRGSIGAFANIVLRNQCSRIAIRHYRQRRAQGGSLLSLDMPLTRSHEPFAETLREDEGLAAWLGQDRDAQADSLTRESVQAVLARLPEADRRFCRALAHRSVTALAADGFGSRSALYRRLADLRLVLAAYGLGPSWDDLGAA